MDNWWNKYVGIPFVEKGRDTNGWDCWGCARHVYANDKPVKVLLPSYLECYDTTQDRDTLANLIFEERTSKWIEPEKPEMFDIIIINMRGVPMHVGIVTKPNHMLHCAVGMNTVHEKYNGMKWKDKIVGFARYS